MHKEGVVGWVTADAIEAIDDEVTADESVASRAGTSSPIAVKEQTSFTITTEGPVTIDLKDNTDIVKVERPGREIDVNNVIA
jgi:hypothetical protein